MSWDHFVGAWRCPGDRRLVIQALGTEEAVQGSLMANGVEECRCRPALSATGASTSVPRARREIPRDRRPKFVPPAMGGVIHQ